jgi:phage terminase large subunit-like protein
LAGDWIPSFLDEVDEFPLGGHDDQVDAVSLAAGWLTGRSAGRRVVKRQEGRIPVGSGLPGVSLR